MVYELPPAVPRHVEIADDLRRRINAGEWEPGEPFLTHAEMMEYYKVSSSTISSARRVLLGESFLEPRPGARMTVRRPPAKRRVDRTTPAPGSEALPLRLQEANAGRIGEWASQTRPAAATAAVAELLRVPTGEPLQETRYQFRSAGQIVRLSTCSEPASLVAGTVVFLPEEGPYAGHSVEERMQAIGLGPLTVEDELMACPATLEEGQMLGVGVGSPVLRATRVYCGPDGRPVHVEQATVRGDTSAMVYRLQPRR